MNVDNDRSCSSTPAKKAKLASEERIKLAGRIASVHLTNFMCHKNLLLEFETDHNNCFYIGGPNGSGKSALFAAINLGLGGTAAMNERGNNVATFIKDGERSARIAILLTNEGCNASSKFGAFILVERSINKSGTRYALFSKDDKSDGAPKKLVSDKKEVLDQLLRKFNIHISNPTFWMSQDRSRDFLSNFQPSKMYKMYLESTNMEKISMSYRETETTIQDSLNTMANKKEEFANETRELERMLRLQELQEKLRKDSELIKVFSWKLLFCGIRDCDDKIVLNDRNLEEQKNRRIRLKAEYTENRKVRGDLLKEREATNDELVLHELEVEGKREEYANEELLRCGIKLKIETCDQHSKMCQLRIRETEEQLNEACSQLNNFHIKNGNKEIAERLRRQEDKCRIIRDSLNKLESNGQLAELRNQIVSLQAELEIKKEEYSTTRSRFHGYKGKLESYQKKLELLHAIKINAINKFGPDMAKILEKIEHQKSKFDVPPKGPLGTFICLEEAKWALAVEACLGKLADNFLCFTQKDAALLKNIFQNINLSMPPQILLTSFQGSVYNNLLEPTQNLKTVYRVLKFTDPDVHNVIIDKSNCEQALLMEDNIEVKKLAGSSNPPENIKVVFSLDGSKAVVNGRDSQYRFYAGKQEKPANLFSEETIGSIEDLQNEIEETRRNIPINEKEMATLHALCKKGEDKLNSFMRQAREKEKEFDDLTTKRLEANRSLADIRTESERTGNGDEAERLKENIRILRETIEDIEKKRRRAQSDKDELQTNLDQVADCGAELEVVLRDARIQREHAVPRLREIGAKIRRLDSLAGPMQATLNIINQKEDFFNRDEPRLRHVRDQAITAVDQKKLALVKPAGEQDPPDLSEFPVTSVAKKMLTDLQHTVERTAKECDLKITPESIKEFEDNLSKKRDLCESLKEKLESLNLVKDNRLETYPVLKAHTEQKICDKFEELLEIRGQLKGRLQFDHEKRTLTLDVRSCKEGNDNDDRGSNGVSRKKKPKTDLKGLSGGERSYVTASLVMALWEIIDQPFRMMDEFDVFMDALNRKLVMDLLVELATKKFPHNQFIFFTPQGIKELKKVDGLQVFELEKVSGPI